MTFSSSRVVQGPAWQTCLSDRSPLQSWPPLCARVATSRVRLLVPLPQVAEQAAHPLQPAHLQSVPREEHGGAWHGRSSLSPPLQGLPPDITLLLLSCLPTPHEEEQLLHAPKAPQTQSWEGALPGVEQETTTPPSQVPCHGSSVSSPLLCQWLPDVRYSSLPMLQPRPPAFQKMYLSLLTCLKTGRPGAHSTKSRGERLYSPLQSAKSAPATESCGQETAGAPPGREDPGRSKLPSSSGRALQKSDVQRQARIELRSSFCVRLGRHSSCGVRGKSG